MTIQLDRARTEDAEAIFALLQSHHLPIEGLSEHLATTIVARDGTTIVGSAALELYADGALMRSVAVSSRYQGRGLGERLTNAAIQLASDRQSAAIYLLTTTAAQYFPRFGFEPIARELVPDSVRASVEFTSACPSTAAVMRKAIT